VSKKICKLHLNNLFPKEVLGLYIGENESSKYWLGILNKLKKPWS
jgi:hypothetical protein